MEIAPGTLLTDHLRLVRPLGHGGMGHVWLADHLSLHAPVAVKLLTARASRDERAVARFAVEAAAAARIRSPHVVEILDCGVADGTPFIVMEHLRGEDLQTKLEREGHLPADAVVPIVRGACRALELAHSMGVVHRDIKPANLFLVDGPDGPRLKVLDFGLAKLDGGPAQTATASGSVFGTLAYLSPEQAQSSRDATWRSDLWSLGVVVYQCLTGESPFAGESLMGMCIAINGARFKPASQVRPELSPALDAWLARSLQRDPADRFASANEMAEAFERAVAETTVAPRNARRSRGSVAARAAGAVVAIGAVVAVWQLGSGERAVVAAPSVARTSPASEALVEASDPVGVEQRRDDPADMTAPSAPVVAASYVTSLRPPRASTTPVAAPSSSSAPAKAPSVRLTMLFTHDLYPPPYVQGAVGHIQGAVAQCFRPAGSSAWATTYEVYTVDVSAGGRVTRVGHPGEAGPPAVDACMDGVLRGLSLRPTDPGQDGSMVLAFSAR